jgi:preprotein translocase subunit SecE
MAKLSPVDFIQQVRNEGAKVTWPTRKEVSLTTLMVFVMSFIAAIFFFFTDFFIQKIIGFILNFGA